jgi:hypothetical protein
MPLQVYFILGLLAGMAILAFMLNRSIKKHDAKMAKMKKGKKGRSKYMPQYKKPGK